jgi:hypothetical protein
MAFLTPEFGLLESYRHASGRTSLPVCLQSHLPATAAQPGGQEQADMRDRHHIERGHVSAAVVDDVCKPR